MAEFVRERYLLFLHSFFRLLLCFILPVAMQTVRSQNVVSPFCATSLCCTTQEMRSHKARCAKDTTGNETLYFPLRIKIEEEYAKNLSKLAQIPLASQEEG